MADRGTSGGINLEQMQEQDRVHLHQTEAEDGGAEFFLGVEEY